MTQEDFFKRYSYSPSRDRIGGGGFGTVYKAYDNVLHREVAIKVSEVKTTADGQKTFSLKDEFEALNHVPKHPNIANYEELYSYEMPTGICDFAIMQYYPDGNLNNAIKQGLTAEQKEDIAVQLLEGIDYLHQHKVVHRDLKPGNILVVKHGGKVIPLITDFGLSKAAGLADGSVFSNSFGGGTPRYSSPEQLQGKPLRLNTDLWSYGAILYELFTGEQLFSAGSGAANTAQADMEVYNKIVNGNVSGLGKMPDKWRHVAERCLVVDATKRAKDAAELFGIIKDDVVDDDETTTIGNQPSNPTKPQNKPTEPIQPIEKERHGFVSFWFVVMIIVNAIALVTNLISGVSTGKGSLFALSALAVSNLVAVGFLYSWKKKGFWLFVVNAALSIVVNSAYLGFSAYALMPLLSIGVLWLILKIKKNGVSCWELLESNKVKTDQQTPAQTKFCKKCGYPIDSNAQFCKKCGNKLS